MLYQIYETRKNENHAGSKARDDIRFFLEKEGFKTLYINTIQISGRRMSERIRRFVIPSFSWIKILFLVRRRSVVVVQNPFYSRQLFRQTAIKLLKRIKKCVFVSVIHDVELLRNNGKTTSYLMKEFDFMKKTSDLFIVHNEKMAEEFVKFGIEKERLVELGLFDYNGTLPAKDKDKIPTYDIVVAGNLSKEKSGYVYELEKITDEIKIGLYGPNYTGEAQGSNVFYQGVFAPEDIPSVLDGRFGLVWDGDDADTCSGDTGNYLRYNDPHKASLYLFAGIPVIVWDEAAVAGFIKDHGAGIAVSSLKDIQKCLEKLDEDEYKNMKENAERISEILSSGGFTKTAIQRCLMITAREGN